MKSEKSGNFLSRKKKKKNSPLEALRAPQIREEVKMWVNSSSGHKPQLLLASDATPAGYSKQRPEGLGPVQQTNRLVRSDEKTLQIWKRTHKQKGTFRENLDFHCVIRANICKLLTGPRHQNKKRLLGMNVHTRTHDTALIHTNINP